jgi:hypothetical protein
MQTLFDDLVELKDNYPLVKAAMVKSAAIAGFPTKPGDPIDVKEFTQHYGLPTVAALLAYLYATSQKDPSPLAVAGLPIAAFAGTQALQSSDAFKNITIDSLKGMKWDNTQVLPLALAAALGYFLLDKIKEGKSLV